MMALRFDTYLSSTVWQFGSPSSEDLEVPQSEDQVVPQSEDLVVPQSEDLEVLQSESGGENSKRENIRSVYL